MSTRKDQLLRRAAGKKGRNVALTREEKALRDALEKMGGGDWNASEGEPGYVKNRTHYEETTVVNEPINITWDGNTEGLVKAEGAPFYRVSDAVLTDEQIKSATVSVGGISVSLASTWNDAPEGSISDEIVMTVEFVVFVRKDGAVIHNSLAFPECGIYFLYDGQDFYTSSLTTTEPIEHTKTVVKKLDKKFLPDNIGGGTTVYQHGNGSDDHDHLYHVDIDTQEIGKIVTREEFIAAFKRGPIYLNTAFNSMEPQPVKVYIFSDYCMVDLMYSDSTTKCYTAEYEDSGEQ